MSSNHVNDNTIVGAEGNTKNATEVSKNICNVESRVRKKGSQLIVRIGEEETTDP
jgi:hypothetical protein